ncbi:amidase [Artemisia annua]|uniref:Amidase n=1 Tax=Artemisia annua TaxID=35608 RepID=A0A2U1KKS7_ARTAN|nr:amidase [Artemisia annua]
MRKNKRVMLPVTEVDLTKVKYDPAQIEAPYISGLWLKFFVKLVEMPILGSLIMGHLKNQNKMNQMLRDTVIPEPPMFRPEFPPQEPESGVVFLEEDGKSEERVESAVRCLPHYDPANNHSSDSTPFRYCKIRDFAYSYRQKLTTPSMVAEHVICAIEEFGNKKPPTPLLISFNAEDVRKQAAASTQRFEEGKPLSILDGIFMAIKDDIDCYPHPTNGATTWFHEVRKVNKDAVSVSKLRICGAILVGKANMHELGMGTTGVNPNYGTARNPHDLERYTGGSSSGPAAIVASGICSAALGTDGGGSLRIPSSLCGVVGLKTTYGRTIIEGSLCDGGTVEIIGPIASSVEDIILIYAAILGSSAADKMSLHPSIPCLPDLSSHENSSVLGSLQLGKKFVSMDLKGVKEVFNEVVKNQELVTSSYKEVIDQVENGIKEAIKKIQSVDHPSFDYNKSVINNLKQKLETIWPHDQRLKQSQKELNKSFTKYPKILSKFADPDISEAYRNVDFDSGTKNLKNPTSNPLDRSFKDCKRLSRHSKLFDICGLHYLKLLENSKKQVKAFEFAQNHLLPFKKTHRNELNDLLGWMALRIESENSYGSHLSSQVKQEELVKEMTNLFFSIKGKNLLRVTIEAGARALPTLLKLARGMSLNKTQEWETMKELPVPIDLGSEFQFHSVFVCPVSGKVSNDPYMLPCFHVISLNTIIKLLKYLTREFKCPVCESVHEDEEGILTIEEFTRLFF